MVWLRFTFLHFSMSFFCTQVDVVSQRHKFGSAFLSYFPRSKKIAFVFLTFPYPVPVSNHVQVRLECTSRKKIVHQQRREK